MSALIALAVFVAVLAAVALATRKSRAPLLLAEGEVLLEEITGVAVESQGLGPETVRFPGCIVTLTTRRVVIEQKIPLSKRRQRRYVVSKDAASPCEVSGGFVTLAAHAVEVTAAASDAPGLVLTPRDAAAPIRSVTLFTPAANRVRDALRP